MKLYNYQIEALEKTKNQNRCAYYLDMGLGKTFVGSEKMKQLNRQVNLVVCQKSKINDWVNHFHEHYPEYDVYDLSNKKQFIDFMFSWYSSNHTKVGVINYDLVWRRTDLLRINQFTLLLDESSLIQNTTSKRTRFILKLKASNVVLLSGTPVDGKYERLWSQCKLLGWSISKNTFLNSYTNRDLVDFGSGIQFYVITGYKNIDHLKMKLREYGCVFMKTNEVIELPEQRFQTIFCKKSAKYNHFMQHNIVDAEENILSGDNSLTRRLYARELCSIYSKEKLDAFKDLIESTSDRIIVFYNFKEEFERLKSIAIKLDRPISVVNGSVKDLTNYDKEPNSITFIQYQSGAMGLNLQKANKMIYFSLTESCGLFEQSKKRIHRIGQSNSCMYYIMMCKGSVEEKIYKALKMGKDYTDRLFIEDYGDGS